MDCGPPFGPRAYIASGPLFRQRLLCGPDISRGRLTKCPVPTITNALSPSSIRLGRRPLTSLRGVQIPLVTPVNARRPHCNDVAFFASRHTAKGPRRTGGCIYGITRRREQMSFERGENSGKRNFSEKNSSLAKTVRLAHPSHSRDIYTSESPVRCLFR